MLDGQSFDLVFSDVVMPGMSGVELARRLRDERPGQPVLLATGYSAQVVGDAAAEFQVIAKPYGADSLAAAVARLLAPERETA